MIISEDRGLKWILKGVKVWNNTKTHLTKHEILNILQSALGLNASPGGGLMPPGMAVESVFWDGSDRGQHGVAASGRSPIIPAMDFHSESPHSIPLMLLQLPGAIIPLWWLPFQSHSSLSGPGDLNGKCILHFLCNLLLSPIDIQPCHSFEYNPQNHYRKPPRKKAHGPGESLPRWVGWGEGGLRWPAV